MTATPSKGYEFVNWTEGTTVVSTQASYVFTLSGNRSLTANFTLSTPISELSGSELRVWPNLLTSELRISGIMGHGRLRLTDISGRVVYTSAISSPEMFLPMANYLPGIYFMDIETSLGRQVRKIVKRLSPPPSPLKLPEYRKVPVIRELFLAGLSEFRRAD